MAVELSTRGLIRPNIFVDCFMADGEDFALLQGRSHLHGAPFFAKKSFDDFEIFMIERPITAGSRTSSIGSRNGFSDTITGIVAGLAF